MRRSSGNARLLPALDDEHPMISACSTSGSENQGYRAKNKMQIGAGTLITPFV